MIAKYIRVVSDLHLEQYLGRNAETLLVDFIPQHENDSDSVLILAGDISSKPQQLLNFLSVAEKRFLACVYVPGNHEFYRNDFIKWAADAKKSIPDNTEKTAFSTDDVQVAIIGGVRFIFGTLWADGGETLYDRAMVGRGLNDFRVISMGSTHFRVSDMRALHVLHKAAIIAALKIPFEGKSVVVTHHLPSYSLCHPRFGTEINGGFASHCDDILAADFAPDIWVHGHTHDTIDRVMFNTRIVCNPFGYSREQPMNSFNFFHVGAKHVEL